MQKHPCLFHFVMTQQRIHSRVNHSTPTPVLKPPARETKTQMIGCMTLVKTAMSCTLTHTSDGNDSESAQSADLTTYMGRVLCSHMPSQNSCCRQDSEGFQTHTQSWNFHSMSPTGGAMHPTLVRRGTISKKHTRCISCFYPTHSFRAQS